MNKLKSLCLSLLSIAALVGCSQNDGIPNPDGKQEAREAKITVRLVGQKDAAGLETKVIGVPENPLTVASTINNYTVFAFNADGVKIGSYYNNNPTASPTATVNTTTDVAKIVVVANAGDISASVGTEYALKNTVNDVLVRDILVNPLLDNGGVTQTDTNVFMSGSSVAPIEFSPNEGDPSQPSTANVSVALKHVPALIMLKKITFNGSSTVTDNEYASSSSFDAGTGDFTIDRIFLMYVQRKTHLWADPGHYAADKLFAGGAFWGPEWGGEEGKPTGGYAVCKDFRIAGTETILQTPAEVPGSTEKEFNNVGHWYAFENIVGDSFDKTSPPTAIVIKVKWRKEVNTIVDGYYTFYFGGGEGGSAPIEAGKAYGVTLKLNGSFKHESAGGTGGGSSPTPGKPTSSAAVTVTVTAENWPAAIEFNKEFKD